jgi:small-conductance mechanosensitive channel
MDYLEIQFWDNTVLDWIKAAAIFISVFIVLKIVKNILVNKLSKIVEGTKSNFDDIFLKVVEQTKDLFLLLAGIYSGMQILNIPESWQGITNKVFMVITALQTGLWLGGFVNYMTSHREQEEADKQEKTAVHAFGLFGKIIIWSIIAMVAIQNITGMKMDALITSLGIGGIAIGLAVQNILKDLFASLSIFLDKPFLVGDFIVVDDLSGTVQNIGLKSTRIMTLLGDEVIFSNSDLLESRIHNYRKMERRLVITKIGVATETPHAVLKELPSLFKKIIEGQENATFDRSNLAEFNDYTFDYEIVYHIESADFTLYMNTKEAIYLEIIKRLQEKNVSMPYPTQAVIVNK